MTTPAPENHLPSISGPGAAPGPSGPPPEIEGYEITGRLGEGGMGTVWRAVQRSTRREVALKILARAALGSQKAQSRFEREVELTARLEHPNIARVYDSGIGQGVYYYAMELIDGADLADHVGSRNFTQRQVLELMRTICLAVQHAHQRGVIHRDLKPSNILVTEDGQPHVLDFGLAKALLGDDAGLSISMDGDVTGTPAYMSPEQAAGSTAATDTRSDVYSLGVILCRLLTGEFPHEYSGTRYEMLRRTAEEEPRRPRELNAEIDRELEAVLLKALAREPDDRYTSAGDLARDIGNYLSGDPLAARKPTTAYFLARRIRRYRAPVAVGLCVLIALAVMAVWSYARIADERNLARDAAGRERQARLELEGKVLSEQGKFAEAESVYRDIHAARTLSLGADHPKTLEALSDVAVVLARQREYEQAEKLARQVLAARVRVLGERHADTLTSMHNLGQALRGRLKHAEAEPLLRKALAGRRKTLGDDHHDTLTTTRTLAFVLLTQLKHAEAEALYRRALEGAKRTLGESHPRTLFLTNSLARVLQQQCKHAEAETLLRTALGLMRTTLGPEHPLTLYAMDNLVSVLTALGKDAEAEELVEKRKSVLARSAQPFKPATPLAEPDEEE
jgi:tetratricopeptide (TPR) repeat protein